MASRAGPAVLLAAVLAAALGGLGWAGAPTYAHVQLVGSDPADGATVRAPLEIITLEFDEPVQNSAQVALTGPDGSVVRTEEPDVADDTVTVAVAGLATAGEYTVGWQVVSADGHPIDGELTFTAAEPAVTPDARSAVAADAGNPWWQRPGAYLGLGALVAVGGLAVWGYERRRGG